MIAPAPRSLGDGIEEQADHLHGYRRGVLQPPAAALDHTAGAAGGAQDVGGAIVGADPRVEVEVLKGVGRDAVVPGQSLADTRQHLGLEGALPELRGYDLGQRRLAVDAAQAAHQADAARYQSNVPDLLIARPERP